MAVKLADTLAPMGDFEIAKAKDVSIELNDGSTSDVETVVNELNDSIVNINDSLVDKADKSYVDDNFVTMDKVGTITNLKLPDYTSKNTNGEFANESLGSFSLQAGKYMVVAQALINNINDFGSDGVIGLLMERYQSRMQPAKSRDNTVQLSCIFNLTEAKQMSLYYIGHYKCNVSNIYIDIMKIG